MARARRGPRATKARIINGRHSLSGHSRDSGRDSPGQGRNHGSMKAAGRRNRDSTGPRPRVGCPALLMMTCCPRQASSPPLRRAISRRRPSSTMATLSCSLSLTAWGLRFWPCSPWRFASGLRSSGRLTRQLWRWRLRPTKVCGSNGACVATMLGDLLRDRASTVLVTPDFSTLNSSAKGREGASGAMFVTFVKPDPGEDTGPAVPPAGRECHHAECDGPGVVQPAALGSARGRGCRGLLDDLSAANVQAGPAAEVGDYSSFFDEPSSFQMPGLVFHDSVLGHQRLLPCLTTPAPTAEGRPPPKRMKGKLSSAARQRWLSGNRQYAPWIYEDHGLV